MRLPRRRLCSTAFLFGVLSCARESSSEAPPKSGDAPPATAPTAPKSAAADPTTASGEEPWQPPSPREPHAFDAQDLLELDRISDPQLSPDGQSIVFVRRTTDRKNDKGRTDLWQVALETGSLQQLTKHAEADNHPRFSPDGKAVYFLSSRSGSPQVWQLRLDGTSEAAVTDLPLPINAFAVSPDGKHLVVAIDVFPGCPDLACTVEKLRAREEDETSAQVYDRLFARHWDTWGDGRRTHLFALPTAGGEPVALTAGLDADTPSKPFGDASEFTFTPTSDGVVFAARDAGASEAWSTNFDLFFVPLTEPRERRNLTAENAAWDTEPVFSPDGKTLVWKAMKRPGYESDKFVLVARGWPEGEARRVTEQWDRSVGDIAFIDDARVVVTAEDVGQKSIFEVNLETGEVVPRVTEGHSSSPMPVRGGVAFLRDDLQRPADLWLHEDGADEPRQLTNINEPFLAATRMGEAEQFSFKGAGGDTVHGYVVKPVDFDPSKKYPVAFLIHGGPQGSFGNHFHYRWNPQTYAGAGYAAVMIDFHGSTGYGQAFTDAIQGDWGGKPLEDLKRGLEHATLTYPWLDGERVCALGASYGGFMINWIAGNWPERFRCLVNHDGVFDNRMMYYTTEELWFPEWEHKTPHFENPKAYEKHNPVNHVTRWKTPMLVIHGELDHRVPITQGLATFTALQRRGVASKLLVFPDENHWVMKPGNSLKWHEEVESWLDQHLLAEQAATP